MNKELDELLEKIEDIRRTALLTSGDIDLIVRLIKERPKKVRQAGPAIGQAYWIDRSQRVAHLVYNADGFDISVDKYNDLYPEERFAEAELRAKKLIRDVNKQRRKLNEGKEFGDHKYYILFWTSSGLEAWEGSDSLHSRMNAYPFGLFKDISDCKRCINEFEDELKWFFTDFMPLMEELDDYDWAEAPGWGEGD